MSLAEMWRVIRRRWYVLLPSILLALGLTGGVYESIPPQYQSTAMMSLLASQQSIKGTTAAPGTSNPFLNFDSSLNDTADFLVRRLASTGAARQLAAHGVTGYTAVLAASQGPFIQLTASGRTAGAAADGIAELIGYTAQQLRALQQQQGVPARAMIQSAVIVPGSPPLAQTKRRTQDTLGAGAGALALAVLGTFAVDSLASRRRARRRHRPLAPTTPEPEASSGPERPSAFEPASREPSTAPEPPSYPGPSVFEPAAGGSGVRRRSAAPGGGSPGELISPLTEVRD